MMEASSSGESLQPHPPPWEKAVNRVACTVVTLTGLG
jgi:hypothetical protein